MRRWLLSLFRTLVVPSPARRHAERGQVLPLYALGCAVVIGLAALGTSVGFWRYQQRLEQSAADSAAVAGAIELLYGPANVATFAKSDSATNGYADGIAATTVTVNTPPLSGAYAGDAHAVEVIVKRDQPLFLLAALVSGGAQPVSARAVARNDAPSAQSTCVVALERLTIGGGAGGLLLPNCGLIAQSMTINGNATVTARYIGVASGAIPACGGCTAAVPVQSISPVDPCPTIASCSDLLVNGPATLGAAPAPRIVNGVMTYYPGEYAATLSPGTATLAPGVYLLHNGLSAKGNDVITATGGVTLYNGGGSISFENNAWIDLVPPTSGTGVGIALYQPRTNTNAVRVSGGGTYGLSGMIYVPNADLTLAGTNPSVSELVFGTMTVNGGSTTIDAIGSANPKNELGIGHVVLAE